MFYGGLFEALLRWQDLKEFRWFKARWAVHRIPTLKDEAFKKNVTFREPENCWVVPVAWKSFIILHVRVSADEKELIPDYGLTEEVRRHGV
uniref:Uncharacterized protein n=1 Tax=Thermococcus aciditolerans TaxID=2598455 RepID=A0A5C0SHW9_9EURY|nr:hypothetical protein FPV09_02535 [Thermococcus aciditolerans]